MRGDLEADLLCFRGGMTRNNRGSVIRMPAFLNYRRRISSSHITLSASTAHSDHRTPPNTRILIRSDSSTMKMSKPYTDARALLRGEVSGEVLWENDTGLRRPIDRTQGDIPDVASYFFQRQGSTFRSKTTSLGDYSNDLVRNETPHQTLQTNSILDG